MRSPIIWLKEEAVNGTYKKTPIKKCDLEEIRQRRCADLVGWIN
jgi:hypothetical protein